MTYSTVFIKSEYCPMPDNFARISLFNLQLKKLLALPLFILLTSCASYKCGNDRFMRELPEPPAPKEVVRYENERNAANHWLYKAVPRHRCQIRWYDLGHWLTWMLFGNDDDGIFGEHPRSPYKATCKNDLSKAAKWWLRNPLHNFTYYTIGSAHRTNSEFTLLNLNCHGICCCHYSPVATRKYGSRCTSFYLALHGGKPLVSLRIVYPWKRKTEFYLGWGRRGNFGFKFLPMVNEEKHKEVFYKVDD